MPLLGSIIKKGIEIRHRIRFEEKSASYYQLKELKKLMRKAQFTMFGQTYNFSGMVNNKNVINKFKATVPVHDYNSIYARWWNKTLHNTEDVCWPGKVKYFALSSGTSESSSKHIPVTNEMVKAIQRTSIRQIISLGGYSGLPDDLFTKGILMLGGSTHLNQHGSYFEGDLSGITASKIPFWFQHFYKPGKRISREKDWNTKLDEIVENAPKWDIGILAGVPAWCQLLLERIIEKYKLKTIHDIWPNLTIYVHGGVSMEPYRKSFDTLVTTPLTYIETYLASEGFIAYQHEQGNKSMKLVVNNGIFFEFVPFNNDNFNSDGELVRKPKTLLINEVHEGEEYALLLSTCAGAWRYLIGDVIKFTNVANSEIIITGRTKHFLSLCGEHLSVDNMNKAIEMVSDEMNIRINEFTVSGIKHGSMFAHKWYIGSDDIFDKEELKKNIDNKLKILNDDYRVERTSALKDVIVEVIPHRIFISWLEKKGKVGSQYKFPRVLKNHIQEEWIQFVEAENN
jgi:hypothetical protein